MRFRLFRFGVSFIWIAASITIILLYFYYISASLSLKALITKVNFASNNESDIVTTQVKHDSSERPNILKKQIKTSPNNDKNIINKFLYCYEFDEANATINTLNEYKNFNFDAEWISKKSIWTKHFEDKFKNLSMTTDRPPLHVVVLPHSHNDPGWLKTFEGYYNSHTKKILNNIINKLPQLDEMTFIWTEVCFLEMWWRESSDEQHEILRKLVDEGRVEIMTGGWVMTDEAVAHIYAMVDQLVEGHQWVKRHLNVTPRNSWSIDPFGHGSTMPYIFGSNKFSGAIIQRIHYNWKEWLADRQYGDFFWRPSWDTKHYDKHSVLTHNMPFDMYFVDSSCGPHVDKCKPYDFRWFGNLNEKELKSKADQLIAEYSRSASLYSHNVFLAIVGGDFRYDIESEFVAQYNYKKIIDYVNSNPERYNNTKMQFGTPKDYFRIIVERTESFPRLSGDFFPYGDVFTNGIPAYWTGYFTTRPFLKIIARDLEHNLRNAEILFTLGLNKAKQKKNVEYTKIIQETYSKLIKARRNLGLFQHHDAITGTSKAAVMNDYLDKMVASLKDTVSIQQIAIETIMESKNKKLNSLKSTLVREKMDEIPKDYIVEVSSGSQKEIVLFNSLAQERIDAVVVHVANSNVEILDANGNSVPFQINSIFKRQDSMDVGENKNEFELLFIAKLPALSLRKYYIKTASSNKMANTEIYSGNNDDNIQIVNSRFRLIFDKVTGLLRYISTPYSADDDLLEVTFGAYNSSKGESGAYLFKPYKKHMEIDDIFKNDKLIKIIVTDGEIASFVKVFYGKLLTHSVRLLKTNTHLDEAIYIENQLDMDENHSNFEIFMRLKTSIETENETEFFTDLNGFQWQRRSRVSKIGIEGNYYPVTVGAFIQDSHTRLTFLTSHAQGVTSPEQGVLEAMLDRRTPTDDKRGMEEGVTDNLLNIQKHWITFENSFSKNFNSKKYQVPTIHATMLSYILKYPVSVFVNSVDENELKNVDLLKNPFPCDIHLFNLRALSDILDENHPSRSSLLLVHRMSYNCKFFITNGEFYNEICDRGFENFENVEIFNDLHINFVQSTSLTGLESKGYITSFKDDAVEFMDIKAYNMTFY